MSPPKTSGKLALPQSEISHLKHRYQSLHVTKVNTYALAFHWQGTNENLKPLLLAAHQGTLRFPRWVRRDRRLWCSIISDVVPVEPSTVYQWEHPPYSGHYDGKRSIAKTNLWQAVNLHAASFFARHEQHILYPPDQPGPSRSHPSTGPRPAFLVTRHGDPGWV